MTLSKDLNTILAASVFALMLSACSRDKESDNPVEELVPISVSSTMTETDATRAVITDNAGLKSTGFGVYGYHDASSGNTVTEAFTNQTVSWNSGLSTPAWEYSPIKYWNQTAKYYFVAYSPRLDTVSTTSPYVSRSFNSSQTTASLTIHNIPNWQTVDGTEKDYIYAQSGDSTGYQYVKNHEATVHFKFKHLLARFIVKAYYEGSANSVTPTSLAIGSSAAKVPSKDGEFDWTYQYTTPSYTAPAASATSTSADILKAQSINLGRTSPGDTIADVLFVPFNTGSVNLPITITYTSDGSKTSSAQTAFRTFESGNIYTLTLKISTTINGDNVVVIGADVEKWEDINASGNLYNW